MYDTTDSTSKTVYQLSTDHGGVSPVCLYMNVVIVSTQELSNISTIRYELYIE